MVSLLGMIAEHGHSHRKAVARSIARNEDTHRVLRGAKAIAHPG